MPTSSRDSPQARRSRQRRPDDRCSALQCRRLDARPIACAERQGGVAQSRHCRRHRQRPGRAISRLSAPRQDRVDGPGRQVPDRPGRRTARRRCQVRPGGRGLPSTATTSTRAAPEAASRPSSSTSSTPSSPPRRPPRPRPNRGLNEAQEMRKGGLNSESVPEVLRSPLIAVLKEQLADLRAQDRRAVCRLRRAASPTCSMPAPRRPTSRAG